MILTGNDIKRLYEARDLILKDISRHYTIEEIAVHCMISPTKLKKGFKAVFGTGPFELLENHRLEKAKEMMSDRDIPLKIIAAKTGFKYPNNFTRAFKKQYGTTPSAWRRSLR